MEERPQRSSSTSETPTGAIVGTTWHTDDIWLRREIDFPAGEQSRLNVSAWFHHDEDAEVYINGVLALKIGGFTGDYDIFPLTPAGLQPALKPGKNLVAIHCHQTRRRTIRALILDSPTRPS